MKIIKLLSKYPKDLRALQDAMLGLHLTRNKKANTWGASTFSMTESGELEWSSVTGYESPRRAVLHAARAGVEARMKAALVFGGEKVHDVQA